MYELEGDNLTGDDKLLIQVAVLGGTGKEGGGLAYRWAHVGYDVIIGSRQWEKAERAAADLNNLLGADAVRGMDNFSAAQAADIVVLSVPYAAHQATLEAVYEAVQGKVLVDVTVPLNPPDISTVYLPEGRSAAEEAQWFLGDGVRVVSAFQNISALHLKDLQRPVECDVLVCGDDDAAKEDVMALAKAAGMRGIDAGPLANALVAESLTPILLGINKRYGITNAGIRITGV
jgi:NADPH-dependent F420 reductase